MGQVEGVEAFLAAAGLADEVLRAAGPLEGLHHGGGLNLTQKRKDFINAGICTVNYTDKKSNFPHILVNSEWISCKVVYEEELPNI